MDSLFFWVVVIILGIITAAIAAQKGRNPVGWFLFGAALALLAIPMVLILPAVENGDNAW